jgi:hypothetical protein
MFDSAVPLAKNRFIRDGTVNCGKPGKMTTKTYKHF